MSDSADSTIVRAQQAIGKSTIVRTQKVDIGQPAIRPPAPNPDGAASPPPTEDLFHNPLCRSATRTSQVSKATLDQSRIVAVDDANPVSAAIDLLRTQVLQEMRAKKWRTLGITSPMPHCGKTTLAINLAISIARVSRKKAVLVDFDLRDSRVGKYLDIDTTPGIGDYLRGSVAFEDTVVDIGVPRLLVVPNDAPTRKSSELLNTREASALLRRLKDAGDIEAAVIDLPPILPTDDTLALLPQLDCVLMVAADGVTTKRELKDAQRAVRRGNVLGTILNKTSRTA